MKDTVIIVSGGMDSITLLYDMHERIALGISFDYGSNHNAREIPYAKKHCERLGIRHVVINLDFMPRYFKSSLLDGAAAIPEGHYADDNMKSTVVPFRNGIMLAAAASMSEATRTGTYPGVEVLAPYKDITKGDIALRGKALGIDYAETWSCYKGGEKHCGRCGTCVERKEAMAYAGLRDTTEYMDTQTAVDGV